MLDKRSAVTLEVVKLSKWLKILKLCLIAAVVAFGVAVIISYIPRRVQQEFMGIELLVLGEQEYEILQTVDIRIGGHGSLDVHLKMQKTVIRIKKQLELFC